MSIHIFFFTTFRIKKRLPNVWTASDNQIMLLNKFTYPLLTPSRYALMLSVQQPVSQWVHGTVSS